MAIAMFKSRTYYLASVIFQKKSLYSYNKLQSYCHVPVVLFLPWISMGELN